MDRGSPKEKLFQQSSPKPEGALDRSRMLITDVCLEAGPALGWDDSVRGFLPRLAGWTMRPMSPHALMGTLA